MKSNDLLELNQQLSKSEGDNQFVTFSIDEDEFGIEIIKVQEIIGYTKPTHVPNIPDFVCGVINLRGLIIPVIDLRKRFRMKEKEYNKYTVILVVEVATRIVGLIVDSVSDVLTLKKENMQEVPEFTKFRSDYIKGMGKINDKLVLLLNIDKVLTYDEYKSLGSVENVE